MIHVFAVLVRWTGSSKMASRLCSSVRSWRLRATACLTIALGFVAGRSNAQNASNEFWQAQSIYQIVTDRFFDGNAANNNADGNYNPANCGSVKPAMIPRCP